MREASSVLPRRVRNPLTNIRQRSSAMAVSWERTAADFILSSILAQGRKLGIGSESKEGLRFDVMRRRGTRSQATEVIAITHESGDAHVQSGNADRHYEVGFHRLGFPRLMQHEAVRRYSVVGQRRPTVCECPGFRIRLSPSKTESCIYDRQSQLSSVL